MLDLDQLNTFLVATELGNFTQAGRRLHLSQSGVSQQIRELETRLGCPLFVREARRVSLTPAGEQLAPMARKLLDDARTLTATIRAAGLRGQGQLRIVASPLVATTLLMPAVGPFTQAHPGLRIQIDTVPADAVAMAFRDDGYDVAISEGRAPAIARPGQILLGTAPLVVVAAPSLIATGDGTVAERLAGMRVITWPADSACGAQVRQALAAAGVAPEALGAAISLDDPHVQVDAAAAGLGAAIVPRLAAAAAIADGRLGELDVPGFDAAIGIWAVAVPQMPIASTFLGRLQRGDAAALADVRAATEMPTA